MKTFFRDAAILLAFLFAACHDVSTSPEPTPSHSKNIHGKPPVGIILMIGDGMGDGALAAARLRGGPLAMDGLPVQGSQLTSSADRDITDSAAGATALATGFRTNYTFLSVAPDGITPLQTILEAAELRGMSTGLISTSSVTHATPAAFAAHLAGRGDQFNIARQIARSGVDVLLGGGSQWFGLAEIAEFTQRRGCHYARSSEEMRKDVACLVGLFGADSMPRLVLDATPRSPSLAEMSTTALDILMRDPDGFFLMIEGSMIVWAAHNNHGEWLIAETLDFDHAVRAVINKVARRPNTFIMVTADHECGGVTAGPGTTAGSIAFSWTTRGHTAAPVPVFAGGLHQGQLSSVRTNAELGQFLFRLLK